MHRLFCEHNEDLILLEHVDLGDTRQRKYLGRRSSFLSQIRQIDTVVSSIDNPATKVKWHRAVDTVEPEEEVLGQRDGVKDVTALSQDLLTRFNVLEPLLAADKRAGP